MQIAVAQRPDHGAGDNLHLRSVRQIPVARIVEVRGAAHEAQLDPDQIGAIVQIGVVHALIARLLFRLQLLLAEGVEPGEPERNDDRSDRNSAILSNHFHLSASVRAWNAQSRYAISPRNALSVPYGDTVLDCRSARPAFPEPE